MGRTPCCSADGLKKGAWTSEEDQKLIAYIQEHGEGGWRTLPQRAGLQRCGKSCRLRWANYLRPDIKRGGFTSEEEQQIIQLHATLGNRWSAIVRHLPKRTDNEIKNYWNTHIKKRLLETGIDPGTHEPTGSNTSRTSSSKNDTSTNNKNDDQHGSLSSSSSSIPPSSSTSASTQLLNKLAAKLRTSRSFEKLKEGKGAQSISNEGNHNNEDIIIDLSSIGDTTTTSTTIESPQPPQQVFNSLDSKMAPPPPPTQVAANSRLLNKMASRLTTPSSCLTTLKSFLSKSINEVGNNNSMSSSSNNNAVSDNSHYMQRSTSTSTLNSESATTTTNVALEPSELELLNWQLRASSNLIEEEEKQEDHEFGLDETLMSEFMVTTCDDQEFRATNEKEGFRSNNNVIESNKLMVESGSTSFMIDDDHYCCSTFDEEEQRIISSTSSGDNSLNICYNNMTNGGENESLALFEDNTIHYWNEEYLNFDNCGTPDSLVF